MYLKDAESFHDYALVGINIVKCPSVIFSL